MTIKRGPGTTGRAGAGVRGDGEEVDADAHDCAATQALPTVHSAVGGLAREVESMRRAMQQVATTGDLTRVQRLVGELGDTVAALAAAGAPEPAPAEQTPSWLCAPGDRDHVRAMLTDLTRWLDDIYLRYTDAAKTLPECWLWHPDVVEELTWLMHVWLSAYQGSNPSLRLASDWHDRLRPGVSRRIGEYAKGCSLENHLPHRATPPARVPLASAAEAITSWWSNPDTRHEPPPEPTREQLDEALAASNRARPGGDHA